MEKRQTFLGWIGKNLEIRGAGSLIGRKQNFVSCSDSQCQDMTRNYTMMTIYLHSLWAFPGPEKNGHS